MRHREVADRLPAALRLAAGFRGRIRLLLTGIVLL
jgi:hypothetical protein